MLLKRWKKGWREMVKKKTIEKKTIATPGMYDILRRHISENLQNWRN